MWWDLFFQPTGGVWFLKQYLLPRATRDETSRNLGVKLCALFLVYIYIPCREPTYPTLGKGTSSTQSADRDKDMIVPRRVVGSMMIHFLNEWWNDGSIQSIQQFLLARSLMIHDDTNDRWYMATWIFESFPCQKPCWTPCFFATRRITCRIFFLHHHPSNLKQKQTRLATQSLIAETKNALNRLDSQEECGADLSKEESVGVGDTQLLGEWAWGICWILSKELRTSFFFWGASERCVECLLVEKPWTVWKVHNYEYPL